VAGRAKLVGQVAAVAIVAAMLGLLGWKVLKGGEDVSNVGEPAPAFTLDTLAGDGELSLAEYRGKPLVVNFFASWCLPCKDEAPILQKTWEEHRGNGLVVLGIDARDFRQDGRRFVDRHGLTYPVAFDGKGSTLGRWGLTGFPETYFVARDGTIAAEKVVGGIDVEGNRERYDAGVQAVLAQQ
jgi:cytochrome c biogenesis protein CcmG, thiol:disulfide interchange protein DsbE